MTDLDWLEREAERLAAFTFETHELLTKRAHALLTLLLAGAGAAGGAALSAAGQPERAAVLVGLGAVSVWWFALAAVLALRTLRTREVRAPAAMPATWLNLLKTDVARYVRECEIEGAAPVDGLRWAREKRLGRVEEAIVEVRQSCALLADHLDGAYLRAAATPVVAAAALALAHWLGWPA